MSLCIEYISVSELQEYGANARTHSARQVEQIAASIREFGFTNPVLVDQVARQTPSFRWGKDSANRASGSC